MLAIHQTDDVAEDLIVLIVGRHLVSATSAKQSFSSLNRLGFKTIRGDLYVFDDRVRLIDVQGDFYATPGETVFFCGLELLPATEEESV